jgi:GNAT superfamily N-acetyltransferase
MSGVQVFSKTNYTHKLLTKKTWHDFVRLFGDKGASSGCWCMWWRTADRQEFDRSQGEKNKEKIKHLVWTGDIPGLIGYDKDEPIGWCSVAPRAHFPRLERTRTLKKIDEQAVWSITCLFVARKYRGLGVTELLVKSAIDYVKDNGGNIIESYPSDPKGETIAAFVEAGFKSTFVKVGFYEALKRGSRPIMRYEIK